MYLLRGERDARGAPLLVGGAADVNASVSVIGAS
jgi:hypothetical protein